MSTPKRTTVYRVTFWIADGESCYADPYGRTEYRRATDSFDNEAAARKRFRELKKARTSAWIERITTTLLDSIS